jgi:hypothetical protein
MGMSCDQSPTTITVQYVNTLSTDVTFQAVDATGALVPGSTMSLAGGGTVADPVQMTGVPPFVFSAPVQLGADSCSVPPLLVQGDFTQFVWRVEANPFANGGGPGMECVNDQGTVRRK